MAHHHIFTVFLLFLLPFSLACFHNLHCADANPDTTDICIPHFQKCFHLLSHQLASDPSKVTLDSLRTRLNNLPLPLAKKYRILVTIRSVLLNLNPNLSLQQAKYNVNAPKALEALAFSLRPVTSNFQFHEAMAAIFRSMHDRHTFYRKPSPFLNSIATLELPIRFYYDRSKLTSRGRPLRRYIVAGLLTDTVRGNSSLDRGSEILTVDGVDVDRVVRRLGNKGFGSNGAARLANGVLDLTFKRLGSDAVPVRKSVKFGYRNEDGIMREVDVTWQFIEILDRTVVEGLMGMNGDKESWMLMGGGVSKRMDMRVSTVRLVEGQGDFFQVRGQFRRYFFARKIKTKVGEIGVLTVFSFSSVDVNGLTAELTRILRQMPKDGLVVDLRGNSGGNGEFVKVLAELLSNIQVPQMSLTVRASLLGRAFVTSLNREILQKERRQLEGFRFALRTAIEAEDTFTGPVDAEFSRGFKRRERAYFGPVVTVVNGMTFSAGDMYAALQVDQPGGSVLVGTSGNVGAGGSSTILYSDLVRVAPGVFGKLDGGVDFATALLRFFRTGKRPGGIIENFGVRPTVRYFPTRDDILNEDCDLYEFLGKLLVHEGPRKNA